MSSNDEAVWFKSEGINKNKGKVFRTWNPDENNVTETIGARFVDDIDLFVINPLTIHNLLNKT